MQTPTDRELVDLWKDEPAPLLPLLHAFHNRDGYITEAAVLAVSGGLKIPKAELWGTVTFYHHFSREAPGQLAPRVCTGNVCCLNGGRELLESMADQGATPMPCAGRCDDMVPVLIGDKAWVGETKETLSHKATPMPAPNPAGSAECIFDKIREPGRATLKGYRATGGYFGLEKAVKEMTQGGRGGSWRSEVYRL